MIQKVSFRNFKAYRSLDLELEPFTVLVGPNASGKTTLLEGLELISRIAVPKLRPRGFVVAWEPLAKRSYGSTTPIELAIAGVWKEKEGSFRIVRDAGEAVDSPAAEARKSIMDIGGQWGGKEARKNKCSIPYGI